MKQLVCPGGPAETLAPGSCSFHQEPGGEFLSVGMRMILARHTWGGLPKAEILPMR